jgi:hypothetical protein
MYVRFLGLDFLRGMDNFERSDIVEKFLSSIKELTLVLWDSTEGR